MVGLLVGRFLLAFLEAASPKAGPAMVLVCGGIVLWQAVLQKEEGLEESRMLFGLPLSLSLDNVIIGAGVSGIPGASVGSALGIGAISAAMSCAGLYAGGWLRRLAPARVELVAGAYLCVLAVRMFIADGI